MSQRHQNHTSPQALLALFAMLTLSAATCCYAPPQLVAQSSTQTVNFRDEVITDKPKQVQQPKPDEQRQATARAEGSGEERDTTFRHRFGIYGQYNLNWHQANFRGLPGVPTCCDNFLGGSGQGWTAGLLYEIPLSKALALSLRAGYSIQSGTQHWDERSPRTTVYVPPPQDTFVQGTIRHTMAAELANIGFEPLIHIKPFSTFMGGEGGVMFSVGGRIGYNLQRGFVQEERLIDPPIGGFDGAGTRVRNTVAGQLDNPLVASVLAGLSVDIPLNRNGTIFLTPEVFASYSLMNVNSAVDWRVHQVRAGLALKFAPERTKTPPDTASTAPENSQQPSLQPIVTAGKRDTLFAKLTAVAVEDDGRELPDITFRIEEFLSDNLRPLLPYVFFDEGSDVIPERYDRLTPRETNAFFVEKLHNMDVIATYHHLLNIVGRRMRKHPEATLKIVGCNDYETSEKGNLDLSRRRAEAVRNYLVRVWDIDSSRLELQARNLTQTPTVASTKNYQNEVNQENRRVELFSDTWEILEPVHTADTVRTVSPPVLRFKPTVVASNGVASWSVKAGQNGKLLQEFLGHGGEPPAALDWEIARQQQNVPRAPNPLEYALTVTDNAGRTFQTNTQTAKVEQITLQRKRQERVNDKVIDRYSLILFDFDKAAITEYHKRVIAYIKTQLTPQSSVRITGYTDYTNPLEYSQRLSRLRAESTAEALGVRDVSLKGVGKAVLLYDNKIPEGRFYCRTVNILVETPIASR